MPYNACASVPDVRDCPASVCCGTHVTLVVVLLLFISLPPNTILNS